MPICRRGGAFAAWRESWEDRCEPPTISMRSYALDSLALTEDSCSSPWGRSTRYFSSTPNQVLPVKTHPGASPGRRKPLHFSNPMGAPYLPLRSVSVSAAMMPSSAPCPHSSVLLLVLGSLFPSQRVPSSLSSGPALPSSRPPASALASLGRLRPAPWLYPVVGNRPLPGPETDFFSFVSLCLSQPSKKLVSRNPDQAL